MGNWSCNCSSAELHVKVLWLIGPILLMMALWTLVSGNFYAFASGRTYITWLRCSSTFPHMKSISFSDFIFINLMGQTVCGFYTPRLTYSATSGNYYTKPNSSHVSLLFYTCIERFYAFHRAVRIAEFLLIITDSSTHCRRCISLSWWCIFSRATHELLLGKIWKRK